MDGQESSSSKPSPGPGGAGEDSKNSSKPIIVKGFCDLFLALNTRTTFMTFIGRGDDLVVSSDSRGEDSMMLGEASGKDGLFARAFLDLDTRTTFMMSIGCGEDLGVSSEASEKSGLLAAPLLEGVVGRSVSKPSWSSSAFSKLRLCIFAAPSISTTAGGDHESASTTSGGDHEGETTVASAIADR